MAKSDVFSHSVTDMGVSLQPKLLLNSKTLTKEDPKEKSKEKSRENSIEKELPNHNLRKRYNKTLEKDQPGFQSLMHSVMRKSKVEETGYRVRV